MELAAAKLEDISTDLAPNFKQFKRETNQVLPVILDKLGIADEFELDTSVLRLHEKE